MKAKKTLGTGLVLNPNIKFNGEYILKNIQFEKGSVLTDWDKSISDTEDVLSKEIEDVLSGVSDLDDYMNTIFKDSIISHSERLILEEKLRDIDKEKLDIDEKYQDLYNNPDLI